MTLQDFVLFLFMLVYRIIFGGSLKRPAWNFCFLSAGNLHAHKIPRFRGGGFWIFLGGVGGEVRILFLWAWGLSDDCKR